MKREYLVVVEKGKSSYGAYIPDLPGCVAVGKTKKEVEHLIKDAMAMHLEAMQEDGETIPEPVSSPLSIMVA